MRKIIIIAAALAAGLSGAVAQEQAAPAPQYLAAPGADWALAFQMKEFGLETVENSVYNGGTSRKLKTGMSEKQLMLSVFIERLPAAAAAKIKSSSDCRDLYWESQKNFPLPVKTTSRNQFRDMALLQREIEMGDGLLQKSVRAYLYAPGYCVDLHISKTDYRAGDSALLNGFLKQVKLVKDYKQPAEPEADSGLDDAANAGIMAHMSGDHKNAIKNLSRVLESEKKQRTRPGRSLIPLIDALGVSYGMDKDYKKALETFEYGLSLFPTHTPFNYNRACTYAEAGDLDKALAELELAYTGNPKMKPFLPNPARDSSFAKYRSDPKFRDFLARNSRN
jgi:tetratricopeptide (TPR) repeat protein